MPYLLREKNWFSFDVREGEKWELIKNEEFNSLIGSGKPLIEAPPLKVSRRQLFLWLLQLDITRAKIRELIEPMGEAALIEFDEAFEFNRGHPLLIQLGEILGLKEEQIDEGFRIAVKL